MWQYINYGEMFRFIIESSDGSEILGYYRPANDEERQERRDLVNLVRCHDSCDADHKGFEWTVTGFDPRNINIKIFL